MTVTTEEDHLVVEDRPGGVWAGGLLAFFGGLALMVLPWMIDVPGESFFAFRALIFVIGAAGIYLCIHLFLTHPSTTAVFDKGERVLSVRRWFLKSETWEIPFQAIEMMTIGEKKTPEGDYIYRITINTRNGARVPLSRWLREADGMRTAAKTIESWLKLRAYDNA